LSQKIKAACYGSHQIKERREKKNKGERRTLRWYSRKEKNRNMKKIYLHVGVKETKNPCMYSARERRLEKLFFL
jgi:hypothetical protein